MKVLDLFLKIIVEKNLMAVAKKGLIKGIFLMILSVILILKEVVILLGEIFFLLIEGELR